MAIVNGTEKILSLAARKGFGYSQDCGTAFFGWCQLGENNPWAGIYQRKRTKVGWEISKSIFYWPSNPRTPTQQANRNSFKALSQEYAGLTDEEKRRYTNLGRARRMSGINAFIQARCRAT